MSGLVTHHGTPCVRARQGFAYDLCVTIGLELAGLSSTDGDGLGEPFAGGWLLVPALIEKDGDDAVHWSLATDVEGPRRRAPNPSLLAAFMNLADAEVEAIVRFARRWGVLNSFRAYCPHGRARRTSETVFDGIGAPARVGVRRRATLGPNSSGAMATSGECLTCWHLYALDARDTLNDIARVRLSGRGRPSASKRQYAARQVQRWIDLALVRPRVTWGTGDVTVSLSGAGLLGAVAMEILTATTGRGIAMCGCGQWHVPSQPRPDRRSYCELCRKQGVPSRDAARAYRLRMKDARMT